MKRYSNITRNIRWDGKETYKTTYYPTIQAKDSDIVIITNETDTLDSLSYKYFNDPSLYFIIPLCNPGIFKGRLSVEPGLYLRIPTDVQTILNDFYNLNK